jgi:hypothetical protein
MAATREETVDAAARNDRGAAVQRGDKERRLSQKPRRHYRKHTRNGHALEVLRIISTK